MAAMLIAPDRQIAFWQVHNLWIVQSSEHCSVTKQPPPATRTNVSDSLEKPDGIIKNSVKRDVLLSFLFGKLIVRAKAFDRTERMRLEESAERLNGKKRKSADSSADGLRARLKISKYPWRHTVNRPAWTRPMDNRYYLLRCHIRFVICRVIREWPGSANVIRHHYDRY